MKYLLSSLFLEVLSTAVENCCHYVVFNQKMLIIKLGLDAREGSGLLFFFSNFKMLDTNIGKMTK